MTEDEIKRYESLFDLYSESKIMYERYESELTKKHLLNAICEFLLAPYQEHLKKEKQLSDLLEKIDED